MSMAQTISDRMPSMILPLQKVIMLVTSVARAKNAKKNAVNRVVFILIHFLSINQTINIGAILATQDGHIIVDIPASLIFTSCSIPATIAGDAALPASGIVIPVDTTLFV